MWDTIGHSEAKDILLKSHRAGALSHSYLISGAEHVGKSTLAYDIAKLVNCAAPDSETGLHCNKCRTCQRITRGSNTDVVALTAAQITDTGETVPRKNISIEQIHYLRKSTILKPLESKYRVYVVLDCEKMSLEASNALLKILEEPPPTVIIILTTSCAEELPQTVVSRCSLLALTPAQDEEVRGALENSAAAQSLATDEKEQIVRWAAGRVGWAMAAATDATFLDGFKQASTRCLEMFKSDLPERFAMAHQMSIQWRKNRPQVLSELAYWAVWWRHTTLRLNSPSNPDQSPNAADDVDGLSVADAVRSWEAVMEAREMLEKNVQARLTLEMMALKMSAPNGGKVQPGKAQSGSPLGRVVGTV